MNNFFKRTITGAFFVLIVVGSAIWNFWAFAVVFGIFTVFGTLEFFRLIGNSGIKPFKIFGTLIALLVYTTTVLFVAGEIEKHISLFYFRNNFTLRKKNYITKIKRVLYVIFLIRRMYYVVY